MREYNVGVYGRASGGAGCPVDEAALEHFARLFEEEGRALFTSEPAFLMRGSEIGARVTVVAEGPLAAAALVEGVFGRAAWRALGEGPSGGATRGEVRVEVDEVESTLQEKYEERLGDAPPGDAPPGDAPPGDDPSGDEDEADEAGLPAGLPRGSKGRRAALRALLAAEALVSSSEAAEVLGLTRQGVEALEAGRRAREEDRGSAGQAEQVRFPAPVGWPAGRAAWLLADIESYSRGRGRERLVTIERLGGALRDHGLSRERAAELAGVGVAAVRRAEAGEPVRVAAALRIAKGIGARLSDLGARDAPEAQAAGEGI